ncbi:MAG: ABC transporter permease [Chloroflexi bacterium]|nr:ABC transporter permease [Chloroflexota bacterium]MDA1228951.1 ABC transporter permease [Chloroflexota bacterium]
MANLQTTADLLAQDISGANRGFLAKAWNIFRRWPIIPIVVLSILVFTGVFAGLIAPHNPYVADPENRNIPPIWYPPIVLNAQDASDALSFPVPVNMGIEDAAAAYGVDPTGLDSGEKVREAFLEQGWKVRVQFPTWDHILGGDQIGRDLLSRVIHGARVSLIVTAISLTSGMLVGISLGLVSGYYGGMVDEIIMRITDIWLGLPFILIAIVAVIALGQTFVILLILLALLAWPPFIRNVRGEVLTLKTRDYVALAKVAGASTFRIMVWHILPGVFNTVIVIATLRVGQLILAEAILSFLGAGIPPPTPAWGAMVADGRTYLNDAWWIAFFPGVAIFLLVMSLNFLGDWMRDRFDPRLRQL